jgi:tRNA (Thr-GGU) A37 N-methylase
LLCRINLTAALFEYDRAFVGAGSKPEVAREYIFALREPVRAERLGLTLIRISERSRMEEAG